MSSIVDSVISSASDCWLNGYEVMVLNGNDSLDKVEIEQKVASVGGKIVQSPPEENSTKFLAIAGKDCGIRVKNFKALKTIDLINFEWFSNCENESKFINLKPKNFFYLTEETRRNLLNNQKISIETNEELKEVLNEIVDYERDPQSIAFICKEFLKHEIELPKWQKGFNQIVPLPKSTKNELEQLKEQFEKLQMEMIGAQWI